MVSRLLMCFCVIVLAGCSSMKPQDFAGREPRLVLEDYFLGQTKAYGIFEDRFGNLRSQFTVDITGRMEGNELILEEDFLFDDGSTDRRVWRIKRTGENGYEGRAGDVKGVAEGEAYGNALYWTYLVDLKMGERTVTVRFKDWLYLQPDGVLVNRADVSKFGIRLGEVSIFFRRVSEEAALDIATDEARAA